MSEYQYYEFLAIDMPLSAEDMAYVRTLSSHVQPTPTHAVFTYSFGDFCGDPLRAFMEFFGVDRDLVDAAAAASPPLQATDEPIERWVSLLPEVERNVFLVRAARGEPIGAELLRRLRKVGGTRSAASATAPRRTFAAIVQASEEVRRQRQERERQEAERARLAKLETLAKREEQVWKQLPELLARRTASGYDEAVAH